MVVYIVKVDVVILKGLLKVKIEVIWVFWIYYYFMLDSGYGVGVVVLGWYYYLWYVFFVYG